MRKFALWSMAVLLVLAGAAFVVSVAVSRPLFDETLNPADLDGVAIAPVEKALTFARAAIDAREALILVTQYRDGKISGVNLNARLEIAESDAIKVFQQVGYDALMRQGVRAEDNVTVDAASLRVPFETHEQNIGVGLNYREHARESSLDEEPFLFPKFAQPSSARSDIARDGSRLLDYEAEVGLVALENAGTAPAPLGLVLANEVTDRWPLVRNLKRSAPMGTTGFADGKSRRGFAPIGPLLVIPRDVESFCNGLELRLYVNDRLRQREKASAMLWSPQRVISEILARKDTGYVYRDGNVRLLGETGHIAAGTIVFSGTPAGVIFKPLNLWNPRVYLQPGDEVVIRADYLGVIRNRIVE